jgi:hypothetical protein
MKIDFFPADFRKTHKNQISRKSVEWEPRCSMQTDMEKLTVAFRIANASKTEGKKYTAWVKCGIY